MRVLVGYTPTGFMDEAKAALAEHAPDAELVDVSGDQFNYWNAIAERWTGEQDLVIVEQDNVLQEDILPSFAECDQEWCVYEYDAIQYKPFTHVQKISTGLGCVRFSAELQRELPIQDFAIRVDWHVIDIVIANRLIFHGLLPHVHGEIEHLHNYTSGDLEFEMVGAADNRQYTEVSAPGPGGDHDTGDVRIRRARP